MTDIIDLLAARKRRDRPDANCIKRDDQGREMFLYSLEYKFQDGTWCVELWAYSMDEAEQRVQAMRESLTLAGCVHARGRL